MGRHKKDAAPSDKCSQSKPREIGGLVLFLVLDRVVVFDQIGHRCLAFFSPLKTDSRERVVQGVLLIEVTQQGQKWRVQNVAVKEKFEHAGCAVRGDDHDG